MPLVAIVGRPNVGKSTLFNRLTERRQAIVHDMPGVTRDRVYGDVEWTGRTFELVDTGGFVPRSADRYEEAIREQVFLAMDEADLILFVVDVTTGITDIDDEMAALLRKSEKPVLVVANKSDNEERRWESSTFYQLGLPDVLAVSATSGLGTGDLLDEVLEQLPDDGEEEEEEGVQIAIIGRPNVGKSSLVNKLLGHERVIVTEEAGTTRDAIHTTIEYADQPVTLVDTAGLRRKTRVKENVEFYASVRTERAVRRCHVAVLLIEALEGMQAQDTKVLKMAEEMHKGLVIGINKWDLVVKEENIADRYIDYVRARLHTMAYVPIVFISALTGQRVHRLLDVALEVAAERERRIPTSQLNKFLEEVTQRTPPPSYRGHAVRIKYATQIRSAPPVFVFFCNHPEGIHPSYERFLENQLRERFGFTGVPLILRFKKK